MEADRDVVAGAVSTSFAIAAYLDYYVGRDPSLKA